MLGRLRDLLRESDLELLRVRLQFVSYDYRCYEYQES